jgi:hypothetical protein
VPGTGNTNCVVFNLSTTATITGNIAGPSNVVLSSVLHSGSGRANVATNAGRRSA